MAAKKQTKKTKPTAKKAAVHKKTAAKKIPTKKTPVKKPATKKPAGKPRGTKKGTQKPAVRGNAEARFWALIEDAWKDQSREVNAARAALSTRKPGSDPDTTIVDDALDEFVTHLRTAFEKMPKAELVAMDGVLERKLYDLDRAEVQAVTDGSDDGFLYARGYVVALGEAFYDAVNANAKMAICDAECEEMCYLPATIHEERFGGFPDTGSKISRESCSNAAGWPRG